MDVEIYILGQNSITLRDIVEINVGGATVTPEMTQEEMAEALLKARDAGLEVMMREWEEEWKNMPPPVLVPNYWTDPDGYREAMLELERRKAPRKRQKIKFDGPVKWRRVTWGGQA